jgi:lipopolysaccharide transport system permease protein
MPFSFLATGLRHRHLILRLTRARLDARYRDAWLGWLWLLAVPLLLLGVYTFVFSEVFRARWDTLPGPAESGQAQAPFALMLFCGLTLYGLVAQCVNEAPSLLATYQSYLKQLLFPSEVLAWVCVLSAAVPLCANLLLLFVVYIVMVGVPPPSSLWLPFTIVPLMLLTVGVVWFLSSLGVFLRDLSHGTAVFTSALLFLSPVFYPASRVPVALRGWFELNPLTPILEAARRSLFEGQTPEWGSLAVVTGVGLLVAWGGHAWFMRTKGSFVDVL